MCFHVSVHAAKIVCIEVRAAAFTLTAYCCLLRCGATLFGDIS
jgi:hypothetical protein